MNVLVVTFSSIVLFSASINAAPPDPCLATFRWEDCGREPQPVMYYWKPGSRCEVGIWRGCLPSLNMFKDELSCISTCIISVRAQAASYHNQQHDSEQEEEEVDGSGSGSNENGDLSNSDGTTSSNTDNTGVTTVSGDNTGQTEHGEKSENISTTGNTEKPTVAGGDSTGGGNSEAAASVTAAVTTEAAPAE